MAIKMKILRRNDGAEFPYSEALAKRNNMRVIEIQFDKGQRVGKEVDLSRLEDAQTNIALRQAIARKWPYLVEFIAHPERLPGFESGEIPPEVPEGDGILDTDGVKPAGEAPDETPAPADSDGEPADEDAPPEVDPILEQVQAFAERLRAQPNREKVAEVAASEGIEIGLGQKGRMISEATSVYEARLREDEGKE